MRLVSNEAIRQALFRLTVGSTQAKT